MIYPHAKDYQICNIVIIWVTDEDPEAWKYCYHFPIKFLIQNNLAVKDQLYHQKVFIVGGTLFIGHPTRSLAGMFISTGKFHGRFARHFVIQASSAGTGGQVHGQPAGQWVGASLAFITIVFLFLILQTFIIIFFIIALKTNIFIKFISIVTSFFLTHWHQHPYSVQSSS